MWGFPGLSVPGWKADPDDPGSQLCQFLVDKGILSPEEAESHPYRNIITRAVGMESVEADAYSSTIAPGDSLLLCSDGLTTHVKDEEIAACLQGSKSAEKRGRSC